MTKGANPRYPRIVFINRYFFPDHSATSQMLTDLAFGLAGSGRSINIVTSRQLYEDASAGLSAHETMRGVEIWRAWSTSFGRAGVVGRACDYLSFYIGAGWLLLRHLKAGDIVVAKTDPPLLSVMVGPIARWRRAKLVNWLQDIFPEVAQTVYGDQRGTGWAYAALTWLRTRSLKHAVANVVLGRRMQARVAALGVSPGAIVTIPNWADGSLVHPVNAQHNAVRADWALGESFTVGYSGNLGRAHEFDTVLKAAAHLERLPRTGLPPVRWVFVGGGALFDAFQRRVAAEGLSSIVFKPYQPRERLAESLAAVDVHLVSLLPKLEGLIVPSKYYGIAAAGKPCIFIGAADGEIARLLEETCSGLTVAPGDGVALAEAVEALSLDAERCRSMGENARHAFERAYEFRHALAAWDRLLTTITSKSAATTISQGATART